MCIYWYASFHCSSNTYYNLKDIIGYDIMIIKLVNVNEVSIIKDHRVVPYPVSAIWILHWNWTLHYFLMPTKLYNKCISGWGLKGRDLIVKCVFLDSNYSMNMFDYNCQWNVRNKMIFQHTAEVGDTHIWIYHRFFFLHITAA